jgi:SRSO17 transposase
MPIDSIPNNSEILNYINSLNLDFSKPQVNHLKNLVTGIINIESKRNISNLSKKVLGSKDRSCVTRFLNNSPWDGNSLDNCRINNLLTLIKPKANEPIFIAIDDTVITKSKDTKHIEALGYHFSHTEGKSVWGHCIVSSQIITKTYSIPLGFEQYFNENYCVKNNLSFETKLEIASDLVDLFTKANAQIKNKIYILTDSWFASKDFFEKNLSYGYHTISGFKSSRCIYPKGIRIKISDFIAYTSEIDFEDITIKDKTYKVYRYEGKASGIDNAVVLICYEANKESPKIVSILSTDTELSNKKILQYYSNRWKIETSFLYLKDRLGLKHYQIRKIKGFTRFWLIVYLAYTLLELYRARISQEKSKLTLGDAIQLFKGATFKSLITWTYILATLNLNLSELYKVFGLTP